MIIIMIYVLLFYYQGLAELSLFENTKTEKQIMVSNVVKAFKNNVPIQ